MRDPSRPNQVRPIGTWSKPDRFARVGLNCATCHVGSYRETPTSPPGESSRACRRTRWTCRGTQISSPRARGIPASPTTRSWRRFARRIRTFRGSIRSCTGSSSTRRRKGSSAGRKQNSWFNTRPPQGVGRVDTFNPYKVLLKLPIDNTVGTVNLPSLWNQRMRKGMSLHSNGTIRWKRETRAPLSAPGRRRRRSTFRRWRASKSSFSDFRPPPFPPARINTKLAATGAGVYKQACAGCHATDGANIGKVTDIPEIQTDPGRLETFTANLAVKMNTVGQGQPWRFSHFKKTNGYANMPLDGLWLRAPLSATDRCPTCNRCSSRTSARRVLPPGYGTATGWVSSAAAQLPSQKVCASTRS